MDGFLCAAKRRLRTTSAATHGPMAPSSPPPHSSPGSGFPLLSRKLTKSFHPGRFLSDAPLSSRIQTPEGEAVFSQIDAMLFERRKAILMRMACTGRSFKGRATHGGSTAEAAMAPSSLS